MRTTNGGWAAHECLEWAESELQQRPAPCSRVGRARMIAMGLLLSFADRNLEEQFWGSVKRGPLRLVEVTCLVLSVFLNFAIDTFSRNQLHPAPWQLAVSRTVHLFGLTGALGLVLVNKHAYEEWHDWIMVFLRLMSYPILFLFKDPTCGPLDSTSPVLTIVASLAVFGPVRSFIDALRFPLRFRHHVAVQLAVITLVSFWNWGVCGTCFESPEAQNSVYQACQWTTLATTGIWLDCGSAGFRMACLTFSLQLHVILGVIAASFVIYRKELAWRSEWLTRNGAHVMQHVPRPQPPLQTPPRPSANKSQ